MFKLLFRECQKLHEKDDAKMDIIKFVIMRKQNVLFRKIKPIAIGNGCTVRNALLINEIQKKLISLGKLIILFNKKKLISEI